MEELRVVEAFSGIGSQVQALKNIYGSQSHKVKVVATLDWDVNATLSYDAIHNKDRTDYVSNWDRVKIEDELIKRGISSDGKKPLTDVQIRRMPMRKKINVLNAMMRTNNLGSITCVNIDDIPEHDLFTFSFPCQAFSTSGRGLGVEDIRGTLALDAIKIIEAKKPKFIMFENVKGLMNKKHQPFLKLVLKLMSEAGYSVTLDLLNAKDYNVPQNRERLFGIGVLKDEQNV